jgi:hypothetical protein
VIAEGEVYRVTAEKLEGKFRFAASDQSNTPIASIMKRNELVQLLPLLQGLGIPVDKIKDEIIKQFDLPKSFGEIVEAPAEPKIPQNMPEQAAPPQGLPAEQLAQQLAGSAPSANIELPRG